MRLNFNKSRIFRQKIYGETVNMKGYKLPMMVNVSIGLKFLESRGNTGGRKFYTFEPQTN